MIALQAEVARHLLRSEPDQADTALGHIRHAGRDVLDELSSLLYVLRQPDDGTHAAHPVTSARVGTASQRAGNSVEVLLSQYAPWHRHAGISLHAFRSGGLRARFPETVAESPS